MTEYRQDTRMADKAAPPELRYSITEVRFPFLRGPVERGLLRSAERYNDRHTPDYQDQYRPIDASLWNAEAAYQLYWGGESSSRYLIFWPDRIAEIHFYWDPTPEQIAIAAEKLQNT